MRYTVLWTPQAEQQLAALWLDSEARPAITYASRTVDVLLQQDPLDRGESRYGDLRILFVPPIGIHFTVSELDRVVYVLSMWRIG